jgi:DNA-binding winged helix-turn-helix (wHTH) protein
MALLKFGVFQLDVDARRIYSTDGELAAEPKVIEVLCYLIQHRDRLVPLAELHENVWAGRVVTDTAVRRTISKLRSLLGDTDPDTPLYIKSQMKRGYQFIGEPIPEQIVVSTSAVSGQETESTLAPFHTVAAPAFSSKRWYWLTAALVLMCSVLAFSLWPVKPTNQTFATKSLVNVAGEKILLSVSANGRYHAFTGRLNKTEGWQPYVYDRQLGHLQKIKLPEDVVFPIMSILNDDTLFISAGNEDDANLFIYSMTNLNKPIKMIKPQEFKVIAQAVPFDGQSVLVNGKKKNEKNMVYYLFNMDTEVFTQFTFSSNSNSSDYNLVLSPDKKHFAQIRTDSVNQVQVYRLADKKLIFQGVVEVKKLTGDELNLAWLDNHRLLINTGEKTKQLNIDSGTYIDFSGSERFGAFARDHTGQVFGLLKSPQTVTYYQFQWSQPDYAKRYFTFSKPPLSLSYSKTPNYLWLVEPHQNSYQLNHYQPDIGEKKTYYTANESFKVLAEGHLAAELLLGSPQKQLQLLDTATGQVTQIADVNQKVSFARFSIDGKEIFFTEKIGEEWQVNVFDRKTMAQGILVKGYRVFLPWQQQFIAANDKGQFFLLDREYQVVKPLPLKLNFTIRHQIELRGNQLIAANLSLDSNWRFFTLDLVTNDYQQHVASTLPIKTFFSFSYDAQTAIAIVENHLDSELVELDFNAN